MLTLHMLCMAGLVSSQEDISPNREIGGASGGSCVNLSVKFTRRLSLTRFESLLRIAGLLHKRNKSIETRLVWLCSTKKEMVVRWF